MFSHRTDWPFAQNPLMMRLAELKEQKIKVFDLTESNPTRAGFSYPARPILKALAQASNMVYQPMPLGDEKARTAVAQMYARQGIKVDIERIILTASSSEAYSFLFRLLLDPQDVALFPRPSYPLFDFLGQLNDVDIHFYSLLYDKAWTFDVARAAEEVSARTKALVLVSPNNPTGCFVKTEELQAINVLCREKSMAIICDEVFSDYTLDVPSNAVRTLAGNSEVLTFVLGGLSKSLGLPQMKLSWIVVNGPSEKVQEALKRLEIIADTYLSVNTPAQNALPAWLSLKEKIQQPIQERIRGNQKILTALCASTPFKVLRAEGGWYGIVQLSGDIDEESWVMRLLETQHVFVHPGYFFDLEQSGYIIVSYLTPEKIFAEGLQRIIAQSRSL